MNPTRREVLALGAGIVLARGVQAAAPKKRLGVVVYSYGARRFEDASVFLDYCATFGAGGVQTSLGTRGAEFNAKLRAKAEKNGMYVEGTIGLPRTEADTQRFENELRSAKECGASVMRAVAGGGARRYERFDTKAAYEENVKQAWKSLQLAEPLARKQDMRVAVENHKDWRIDDLVGYMKKLDSKHIGICLDTGNSIALLEEPLEVVKAYAPWTMTLHLKDMGVAEYDAGFLLSEVPLGEGFLDLKQMVAIVEKVHPEAQWNLEMITRDPLKIPVLTSKYWATMDDMPARRLAEALAMVRKHKSAAPLPVVSKLSAAERAKVEEENIQKCFKFTRDKLGWG